MQIEEGKYYKTRDGRKVGPIKRGNSTNPAWYWTAPQLEKESCGSEWHEDGSFWPVGDKNWCARSAKMDLIAEWPTGPVVTETVTKTRIVPGTYGCVQVLSERNGDVVQVLLCNNEVLKTWYTADELDAAAAVLSALAKGLRDA